jgi:hypothetical protein
MLSIRRNCTYRHRRCIDVDMHIVRIEYITPDWFRLDIVWVNRHYPNIMHPDTVKLMKKDLDNWSLVTKIA